MQLHKINKADKEQLRAMLKSPGWEVLMRMYDNFRLTSVASFVDGEDLLPDAMTSHAYMSRYRVRGVSDFLEIIRKLSEEEGEIDSKGNIV
jgi:hypothetical protein